MTTSGTTTVYNGAVACSNTFPNVLYVELDQSCDAQVAAINSVLESCGAPSSAFASIKCERVTFDGHKERAVLTNDDSTRCGSVATVLSDVLREYSGPSSAGYDVQCFLGKYLIDDTNGAATAIALNKMTEAHRTGGFVNCEVTTATTTQTSTVTTTQFDASLECQQAAGFHFISADPSTCDAHARWLTRIFRS